MNTSALVSVIIPTYNYGHFISETLNCLIHQEYQYWEAIIIDDGSTDDTFYRIKDLLEYDKRFIYLSQGNLGVSVARNYGLLKAKGKYIHFLDADDLISPNKIQLQVEYLESNKKIDFCFSSSFYFKKNPLNNDKTDFFSDNTLNLDLDSDGKGSTILKKLIEKNIFPISSPLFTKALLDKIGGFNPSIKHVEDWEFWINCANTGSNFFYLNEPRCYTSIRVHENSVSQNYFLMKKGEGLLRNKIFNLVKESIILTNKEKTILIKNNNKHLKNVYKELIFKTSIFDFAELKNIYKISGKKLFFICSIKAINMKMKSHLKSISSLLMIHLKLKNSLKIIINLSL